MIVFVKGHSFHYEMECLCRVFFPQEKIELIKGTFYESEKSFVNTQMEEKKDRYELSVYAKIKLASSKKDKTVFKKDGYGLKECEMQLATALYEALSDLTGYKPPWGLLTGVRPAKLMLKLLDEHGTDTALDYFKNSLKVSPDKALLAQEVAIREKEIIKSVNKKGFSLYISIPFCPGRCGYCSFVSHSISNSKARKLVDEYLEKLLLELQHIADISKKLNLKAQTVYFGGGTPTSLNSEQLQRILSLIDSEFDLSEVKEYCVEAGRPDTIDFEKLEILKKYKVNRISINPQTFNDEVLNKIKRGHDAKRALEAYSLAQNFGFDTINMDLIAGLPGESLESFKNTVDKTLELGPQNITVHTLALKRASDLTQDEFGLLQSQNVAKMLEYVSASLRPADYSPYYMYRQSFSLDNLENIGWAKAGRECLYNIIMMEECQSVFAAGAGAVTKLTKGDPSFLTRVFNFKYPYEYISRFEEIIKKKDAILEFFS